MNSENGKLVSNNWTRIKARIPQVLSCSQKEAEISFCMRLALKWCCIVYIGKVTAWCAPKPETTPHDTLRAIRRLQIRHIFKKVYNEFFHSRMQLYKICTSNLSINKLVFTLRFSIKRVWHRLFTESARVQSDKYINIINDVKLPS